MIDKILALISVSTEYLEILRKFANYERRYPKQFAWDGPQYHQLGVEPAKLRRLVALGIANISYKSHSATHYQLADIAAVEEALKLYETEKQIKLVNSESFDVPADLFDAVVNFDDLKDLFFMSLHSETPVHIALIGPSGCAKTVFLMCIERLDFAELIPSSSATKAGINDLLFEKFVDGQKCIMLLDELDKMDRKDYSALLGLTPIQGVGRVRDTKGSGKQREMTLRAWVFAAANSIEDIPEANLDRFELVYLKRYTRDEYLDVAVNVLVKLESADLETARYIAEQTVSKRDVRHAIRVYHLSGRKKENVDRVLGILEKHDKRNLYL